MNLEKARSLISRVTCLGFTFVITNHSDFLWLQIKHVAPCQESGQAASQSGRKWRVSYHSTKSELIQTAFKAALAFQEHELREAFRYRDRAIFGPHFDVDSLYQIANERDKRAANAG